ncbi:MAG: ROK family protein [Deltaproteobacteria bacterium]|nr:ROK family protein [Deltaproteobacteria bacterium]
MLLGIDVGGTKVALCVGELGGALRAQRTVPMQLSGDARRDVAHLAEVAREVVAEAGLPLAEIEAVGVSLPGPLDAEGARVLNPPNLPGWHDVPVRDALRDALDGLPVQLENDANAAALAEWHFGAGRGFRSLVYLTMSTGVGGGVILDGRLHRGRNWSAGEIGHTALVWDGEPCFCGLRGCVEAYLGGRAWARRLAQVAPPEGRVAELAGGTEHATPVQVVQAAKEGDAFALQEIGRFNGHLAHTLVNLTFTLDPDVFVLGTIVAAAGEELVLEPVRRLVREHLWPRIGQGLEIRAAELGKRLPYYAGLGAALSESPSTEASSA